MGLSQLTGRASWRWLLMLLPAAAAWASSCYCYPPAAVLVSDMVLSGPMPRLLLLTVKAALHGVASARLHYGGLRGRGNVDAVGS